MNNKSIRILLSEAKKMHYSYNSGFKNLISSYAWPILLLIQTFYSYQSFDFSAGIWADFNSPKHVIVYLLLGFVGYNSFMLLVTGAFYTRREREDGTLEAIFQTPANRLSILFGRALGSSVANASLFILFGIVITIITGEVSRMIFLWPFVFVLMLITGSIWGAFINSIFLFSRDIDIIFTILDEPMSFFAGVKFPVSILPIGVRLISNLFPLSAILALMREMTLGNNHIDIVSNLLLLFVISDIFIVLTVIIEKKAEAYNTENGSFNLF